MYVKLNICLQKLAAHELSLEARFLPPFQCCIDAACMLLVYVLSFCVLDWRVIESMCMVEHWRSELWFLTVLVCRLFTYLVKCEKRGVLCHCRQALPKAERQAETTAVQDPDRPTPPGVVVVPITPPQPHTDTTALFQSSGLIRNKAALTAIGDSCGCMEYGYTRCA